MTRRPLVRITHWINTCALLALLTSGVAILLAHPRLYWGESGGFGSPALIELPLPWNMDQSGWGRSLHFLAAWVCVFNGVVYVLSGLASRHFTVSMAAYNALQRRTYLAVIFILVPIMVLTGLAMSPAVTAFAPIIVQIFGGYQSSRTIHFFVTNLLVVFLIGHLAMVIVAGFGDQVRGMITGHHSPPFQGGVAAPSTKYREASEAGADGVVIQLQKFPSEVTNHPVRSIKGGFAAFFFVSRTPRLKKAGNGLFKEHV